MAALPSRDLLVRFQGQRFNHVCLLRIEELSQCVDLVAGLWLLAHEAALKHISRCCLTLATLRVVVQLDVAVGRVAEEGMRDAALVSRAASKEHLKSLFHPPILDCDEGVLSDEQVAAKVLDHPVLHRLIDQQDVWVCSHCLLLVLMTWEDVLVQVVTECYFRVHITGLWLDLIFLVGILANITNISWLLLIIDQVLLPEFHLYLCYLLLCYNYYLFI